MIRSSSKILSLCLICAPVLLSSCGSTSYTDDSIERTIEQTDFLKDLSTASCFLPWGDGIEVKAGEKITAYRATSTCSSSCEQEKILRTCVNGALTGPNEYMFQSCTPNKCSSCQLPWGPLLVHGQSVPAFREATIACDLSCEGSACGCEDPKNQGFVTCDDGELTGIEEFSQPTCRASACPCPNPWSPTSPATAHGDSLSAYDAPSVSCVRSCNDPGAAIPGWCAGSCEETSRLELLCQDGVYVAQGRVWALDEIFQGCHVQLCNDCSAGTGSHPHGYQHDQVFEYNLSNPSRWVNGIPPCDGSCSDVQGSAVCVDGSWWGLGGPGSFWTGFLNNPSFNCAYPEANCQCELPWGGEFMPHGGDPREVYSDAVPATCNEQCAGLRGEVTCAFGVLQGNVGFNHPQCLEPQDNPNCFCEHPWNPGEIVPHGNAISPVFTADAPQCNQSCDTVLYNDTGFVYCFDGAFTVSFDNLYQTCDPGAANCDCPHPGGGAFEPIPQGASRTFWRQAEVPCEYSPNSCGAASPAQSSCQSQERTCINGELSGSPDFIFEDCQVDCVFCDLPNGMGSLIEQLQGGTQTCQTTLSAYDGIIACGETCESQLATVYCQRVGENASLQFVEPNGNPYSLSMGDLLYPASACGDPVGICSTGGNPTRACSLPGEWDLLTGNLEAGGWYRSHQERPPHTRFPWPSGEAYWTHNYLENYTLFSGGPNEAKYPYGLRFFDPDPGERHQWFYQVSPQTIMTFYDRLEVDRALNPEDHCDAHAMVKRCHPDGFWYPLDETIDPQQLGLGTKIGPSIEPTPYKSYRFTSCRTIDSNEPSWIDTEVTLFMEGLYCLINQSAPGACLFSKNPFADGLENYGAASWEDIEDRQRLGIGWYDSSYAGLLQSPSFRVAELFVHDLLFGEEHVWEDMGQGQYEWVGTGEYCKQYRAEILPDRIEEGDFLSDRHRVLFRETTRPSIQTTWLDNERDYPSLRVQLFYGLEYMTEKLLSVFGSDAVHFHHRSLNVIQGDPLFKDNAAFVRAYDPFIVFGPEIDRIGSGFVKEKVGRPLNYDLSIVAHELGHANLYFASGIRENGDSVACGALGGVQSICCSGLEGCIRAIDEGQADFFSSIIFPDSAAMGDGFAESDEGIRTCGIPRNAEINSGIFNPAQRLTFNQAYEACSAGYEGQVHAMGAVYASIWWSLRHAQTNPADRRKVERLFLEHLKYLDSTSNFCVAPAAVSEAELNLWGTQSLASDFSVELQSRYTTNPCP